jgi:pimeloyl-ACP methyl ester carboxylesterase
MQDPVLRALTALTPFTVRRGETWRDGRALRWVEAGSADLTVICDASLGEPGPLAWAGLLPVVPAFARVVAYDRAGIGASDPAGPLTLSSQVDDLIAVINEAGNPPSILVGHSLGGVLAQLAALRRPDLVAGLVLVDPAEEQYLAALPPDEQQQGIDLGESVISQHHAGTLPGTIRSAFAQHARQLTDDHQLQGLILDAYVSCYSTPSQARMVRDEHELAFNSLPQIRRLRAEGTLPDVPVIVLSATTGRPEEERRVWTSYHAALVVGVPRGKHVVLADTSHAINQERADDIVEAIKSVIGDIRARP